MNEMPIGATFLLTESRRRDARRCGRRSKGQWVLLLWCTCGESLRTFSPVQRGGGVLKAHVQRGAGVLKAQQIKTASAGGGAVQERRHYDAVLEQASHEGWD